MSDDIRHGQDRNLREMMDAVRAAANDLADPDFAPLAQRARHDPAVRQTLQRSQRLDLAIGEALDDLRIPAGSVDRLLAALRRASQPTTVSSTSPAEAASSGNLDASSELAEESTEPNAPPAQTPLWQSWLAPAALVSVAGAALVTYILLRPADGTITAEQILASEWLATVDEAAVEQTPIEKQAPPRRFPAPHSLTVKPIAWRAIHGLLGRPRGVAYQLRTAAAWATVYVIDEDAGHDAPQLGDLASSPAANPKVTGGRAMSVWRTSSLVYILVVQGGNAEYRSFVSAAGQLADNDIMPRHAVFALSSIDRW